MEQSRSQSYISQITKTKVLDHQETLRLARLAKTGDIDARNRIVEGNLRFVTKIATTYKGKGLPLDDLINEGSLGLMTAVERFDPDSGNSFLTYAKFWIHQSISLALKDKARIIRLPSNKVEKLTKIRKCIAELESTTEREVTISEISHATGIEQDEVSFCLSIQDDAMSLDTPIPGTKDKTYLDTVQSNQPGPDQSIEADDFIIQLERILSSLPERHQQVLKMRYGLFNTRPRTLDEVGKHFGITRERVRQLEAAAIKMLRLIPGIKDLCIFSDYKNAS